MSAEPFELRRYAATDEDATIELWRRTWQAAYPTIDFAARVPWWRERWRNELVPQTRITVATTDGVIAGFVTVDLVTCHLDQIVVAPELWGGAIAAALIDDAKRISPSALILLVNKDNARAIRFYQKHGFTLSGDDVNPVSGRPVHRMTWWR